VGLIANQPAVLAGVLDINASTKAAASCVSATPSTSRSSVLWMSPASCPAGTGIRRHHPHGAKLLYAFVELPFAHYGHPAQGYGGAYIVMNSKHIAETSTMPGLRRKSPSWAPRGRGGDLPAGDRSRTRSGSPSCQKTEYYRKTFANPFLAAKRGYIEDVIFPRTTRQR